MKISNHKAMEVQVALNKLIGLNYPVKFSMEIATLSVVIDKQVEAFRKVRDTIIKNYQIQIETLDKPGAVKFTTTLKGEDDEQTKAVVKEALEGFTNKFNELVSMEGEDITNKLHLPNNIDIQPEILKPILPFVEFLNG